VSVQKIFLCPFQCKPRPSGLSLESPGLENIPQVRGIGAEVDQIHDGRNVVSATFSVLKACAYISVHKLESERSKTFAVSISLQNKAIRTKFSVQGTGKYTPSSGKSIRSSSKLRYTIGGFGYSFSLKVKSGYISVQKLESKRSKNFAVCISLQTTAIKS